MTDRSLFGTEVWVVLWHEWDAAADIRAVFTDRNKAVALVKKLNENGRLNLTAECHVLDMPREPTPDNLLGRPYEKDVDWDVR